MFLTVRSLWWERLNGEKEIDAQTRKERTIKLWEERRKHKKFRWLGLKFRTNDSHAEATPRVLKLRLKWPRKVAKDLVNYSEGKEQQPQSSGP
jgi:hypothetical protein